jgi:hypothetical protein
MKKKLLLLLIVMLNLFQHPLTQAQTSVYHPFPDSNAVWNFNHGQIWGCGPPLYYYLSENYSIIINGDTIINSQQYHKLYIPFVQSNCIGTIVNQDTGYFGCVREDTALRKVFYVYPNSSVDSLLYDFNLQAGDTVRGVLAVSNPSYATVIAIDSVLVGSNYRKRWDINPWYNTYLIEGIGSTYNLTGPALQVTDGPDYSLVCFSQNGIPLYPDTATSCNLITGVIDIPEQNNFTFSPNPATSEIRIENQDSRIEAVEVYDVVGGRVKNLILNPSPSGEGLRADVSSLSAGIYFVRVGMEKGSVVKKFVKQ